MAVVKELIRKEKDNSLSFGDYTLDEKKKISDFDVDGDLYKVKTYKERTKLKKNGMFLYESTPGTAVNAFKLTENGVAFFVDTPADCQITLELEDETKYEVFIGGKSIEKVSTNLGGKLTIGVEATGSIIDVKIVKC